MSQPAEQQSYQDHRRMMPIFHYFVTPLSLVTLIAAIVLAVQDGGSFVTLLLLSLALMIFIVSFLARRNAIVVQDRVIRTEEQLRHFMLTGRPLDTRLRINQLIALRFASDDEFPSLAAEAAEKDLAPDAIKKAIRTWRADFHRV
jgi:hypothetical protein